MGSTTQRCINPSLRTPPATLACTFTHGHVASRKVGNYAELCRAPKILSYIRGSPLTSFTTNPKTVPLSYHPTFCVCVRRWLSGFRFDCLSCCDALPSISFPLLALSLFLPLPLVHYWCSYSIKTTSCSLQFYSKTKVWMH